MQPAAASSEAPALSATASRSKAPNARRQDFDKRQCYLEAAAADFGERFAHRLRWAHAVNSRRRLRGALENARTHLLEADVSAGPLTAALGDVDGSSTEGCASLRAALRQTRGATTVRTGKNDAVIMAHYPTERSSDLSLECFVQSVLIHNEFVGSVSEEERELERAKSAHLPRSDSVFGSSPSLTRFRSASRARSDSFDLDLATDDEALAFASDLSSELDAQAAQRRPLIPSCVGPRKIRGNKLHQQPSATRKGIKLDFKRWECVEPTILFLKRIHAAERLGGHLWLNADVFAGPGSLTSPLDAQNFVRLCCEHLPQAVLSLGWGATQLSTTRRYTHEMIDRMVELCMCPIVKHSLTTFCKGRVPATSRRDTPDDSAGRAVDSGDEKEDPLYGLVPPAAVSRHITFAVAAEYALASIDSLKRLMDTVPDASLTIYTGVGSLGVTPAAAKDLVAAFGKSQCFFDLWVVKPWRNWIFGSKCQAGDAEAVEQTASRNGYADAGAADNGAVRGRCGSPDSLPAGGELSGELIKIV